MQSNVLAPTTQCIPQPQYKQQNRNTTIYKVQTQTPSHAPCSMSHSLLTNKHVMIQGIQDLKRHDIQKKLMSFKRGENVYSL